MKHGPSRHSGRKKYCLIIHTNFAYAVRIILVTRNIQTSKEILTSSEKKAEKLGLRFHEEKKIVRENVP
jgi:hypothetical protein